MYSQKVAIGGFNNASYWSSLENSVYNAVDQNFSNGNPGNTDKETNGYIRAVRAF
jgi:hypothetical protein